MTRQEVNSRFRSENSIRILNALLGGLFGGGLGIAVVVLINAFAGYDSAWLGLIVGTLTGLSVGYMAHGTEKLNYLCGTIAVLMTLAAIVLGKYATASVYNVRTAHIPTPVASAGEQPGEDQAITAAKQQPGSPQKDVDSLPAQPRAAKASGQPPRRNDATQVVWLGLAAVIAYFLGRSGIRRQVHPVKDTTPHNEESSSGAHETT